MLSSLGPMDSKLQENRYFTFRKSKYFYFAQTYRFTVLLDTQATQIKLRCENILKEWRKKKRAASKWYKRSYPRWNRGGKWQPKKRVRKWNRKHCHRSRRSRPLMSTRRNKFSGALSEDTAEQPPQQPFSCLTHPEPHCYCSQMEVIPFWLLAWADLTFYQQIVIIRVRDSSDRVCVLKPVFFLLFIFIFFELIWCQVSFSGVLLFHFWILVKT